MKQLIIFALILSTGFILGCKNASEKTNEQHEHQVWTCSMHPQIRQDKAGKCPLCAMDLIPVAGATHALPLQDPNAIQMSEEAAALANVQTTIVGKGNPSKEIRLYGVIQVNERAVHSQVSQVNGRIEKLAVNFAGESIRAGQTVAQIYSSDLLNAQQELLQALKLQSTQPALLTAAREKLRLWKLTDAQIALIEKSGKTSPVMDIKATSGGVVTAKKVEQGDYVNQGTILFDVADLSSVWAVFEAYEADLPYLKIGNGITYTLQALPGKTFSGKIAFIDPILDKTTRTAKIRVETANLKGELKPEMIADATVQAALPQSGNAIVILKTAVLWTGKRSIVYVKDKEQQTPTFRLREIDLGTSSGDTYVVLSGLNEGEEIVTNGAFAIDASAQLEGKPSMMNHESHRHDTEQTLAKTVMEEKHAEMMVRGACEMCRERIEAVAKSIKGVKSAHWDVETQQLHLAYNGKEATLDAVAGAIAKAGHDNERYKADDAVYNGLAPCCKYRG